MVILRCAWHPRNYGRAKWLGIRSWHGRGVVFKDALCKRCAPRIHPDVRARIGLEVPRQGCTAGLLALLLALSTAIAVVARPATDLRLGDVTPPDATSTGLTRPVEAGELKRPARRTKPVSHVRVRTPIVRRAVSHGDSTIAPATVRTSHDTPVRLVYRPAVFRSPSTDQSP
jgi:hypothetical protein